MISRGVVKIKFDSLLSNFYPKLLVRLRVVSSVADCSRRHCVVYVAHRVGGVLAGWSVACVEDQTSLGGCSFDATAIGMCLKDVTLSAEEEIFSRAKIVLSADHCRGLCSCLSDPDDLFAVPVLFVLRVGPDTSKTISLLSSRWLVVPLVSVTLSPRPNSRLCCLSTLAFSCTRPPTIRATN
jgi:hypothetical protein